MERPGRSSKRWWGDGSRALAFVTRYTRSGVRSTHEVLAYLKRHGVAEPLAIGVVAHAQACGLLDDRVCARLWAEQWARRGYAWAAIRQKLAAKGLEGRTIADAAQRVGAASDDDRARLVVERLLRGRDAAAMRSRVARALAARGFDTELIEQVLEQTAQPRPSHAES